ncbi:MAG: hypothetical protein ACM3RP_07100 [Chitinophagales bacterium]
MKRMVSMLLMLALLVAIPGEALAVPRGGGYASGWGGRIGRALLELIGARKIVSDIHKQAAKNRPQTTEQQLAAARLAKAKADAARARAQAEKAQIEAQLARERAKQQTPKPAGAKAKPDSAPDRPLNLLPTTLPTLNPITTALPLVAGLWWLMTHPAAWRAH